MKIDSLKVLLVEDNPGDAGLIEELFRDKPQIDLSVACCLADVFNLLGNGYHPDVVILDFTLPDSRGMETIARMTDRVPDLPIVVLTGLDDDNTGIRAVQMGAQDYLVKGRIDGANLIRSLLYAIQRKEAEKGLKESQMRIRNLSAHLQNLREEEKGRICLRIHDDIGQVLIALKMDLSWISGHMPGCDERLKQKLDADIASIDNLIKTTRTLCSDLSPDILDHFGFAEALRSHAADFEQRTGINCSVNISNDAVEPDPAISLPLFRIAQETLSNVERHAGATTAAVSLHQQNGTLILTVSDDGKGVTPEDLSSPLSFGIIGMRERSRFLGGSVDIKGTPDNGTVVTVTVPIRGKE